MSGYEDSNIGWAKNNVHDEIEYQFEKTYGIPYYQADEKQKFEFFTAMLHMLSDMFYND